jgi:hypothetical protein
VSYRAAQRSNAKTGKLLFGIESMRGLLANLLIAALDPAALTAQLGSQERASGLGSYSSYNAFRRVK